MSKTHKSHSNNNRRLTDFFPSQSSLASLTATPSSSQTRPSLRLAASQSRSQVQSGRKKGVPPRPEQEVISLSSDNGPIVLSSDPPHISISSNISSRSVIVISDSSSANIPKPTKPISQPRKVTAAAMKKSQTRAKESPPSVAKTSVRRRTESGGKTDPRSKSTRSKKRKSTWDSSSSDDDQIFVPKPSLMKPSLTKAPVPRLLISPPRDSVPASPSKAHLVLSSPLSSHISLPSRSSKRARLGDTRVTTNASGNEADVDELVPSSQSDEQELTMPKDKRKNPALVKASVDRWRRESSVVVSPIRGGVSLPPEEPPASSPATSPADDSWPVEPLSPISALHTDVDGDVNMFDFNSTTGERKLSVAADQPLNASAADSEGEVSRQLQRAESDFLALSNHQPSSSTTALSRHSPRPPPFSNTFPPTPPYDDPIKPRTGTKSLTAQEKTAFLIERMKAEALAAVTARSSSDEEELGPLQDLDSDSDDELSLGPKGKLAEKLFAAKAAADAQRKHSPRPSSLSSASSIAGEPASISIRYNLRRRSSPGPVVRSEDPDRPGLTVRNAEAKPKKRPSPLDKLLKEKDRDDKRGTGMDALRAAEAFLSQAGHKAKSKGKMRAEMDNEDSPDEDALWDDEDAAMRCVYEGTPALNRSTTVSTQDSDEFDDSDNEHFAVDAATKLLGGDEGKAKAVNKILTNDMNGWLGKRKWKKPAKGVPFWEQATPAEIEIDESIPRVPENLPVSEPVLVFLKGAVDNDDRVRLSRCLIPQLFSSIERSQLFALVPWLSSIVLSMSEPLLVQRATDMLTYTARRFAGITVELSPLVVSALAALGATQESLALIGAQATSSPFRKIHISARTVILTRLVCIVKAFIENDAVSGEDIPNLIVALLLIGLDPYSPGEVRRLIVVSIDMLSARIPGSDATSDMEPVLCARLLKLADDWTLRNRVFMLSFFCGGSEQVARMARWLAFCMIFNADVPSKHKYLSLPDLKPLITLLSPSTGSQQTFDVLGNAEKDDYFRDLIYNMDIIESILNDVDAYALEEKIVSAPILVESSRPTSPEKPQTELQQIIKVLEVLHGKISDTRAAHLDRTRLKAHLQHCWFRVLYQRTACLRSGTANRPRNLQGYFGRPAPIPRMPT